MRKFAVTFVLLTLLCFRASVSAQERTCYVNYGPGNKYSAYCARPQGNGPFPGLVVIHEWWGRNEFVIDQANKLAQAGYMTLAVDLFGKTTTDPQEAMEMVANLNQQEATAQLLAAANHLRSLPFVKSDKVGSIGWCFGGDQSLQLALNDPKLAVAVIYYGRPVTDPTQLARIRAAILGIYGESDAVIPLPQVREFQRALTAAKVTNEFYTYPGAGHAFANPSNKDAYRPTAAADAWNRTLSFLERYLKR